MQKLPSSPEAIIHRSEQKLVSKLCESFTGRPENFFFCSQTQIMDNMLYFDVQRGLLFVDRLIIVAQWAASRQKRTDRKRGELLFQSLLTRFRPVSPFPQVPKSTNFALENCFRLQRNALSGESCFAASGSGLAITVVNPTHPLLPRRRRVCISKLDRPLPP